MTLSRDFFDPTPLTPPTYDDLVRLWDLEPTLPAVRSRPRRRPDRLMAIAWCSALSMMAMIFIALQWAIQAVGR
jgi:hypothetical protein